MSDNWKISLPCSRAEADALAGGAARLDAFQPVALMTSEPDPMRPDDWRIDVYVDREPDIRLLAAIRALVPGSAAEPEIERLGDEDWVTLSQAGLEPVVAGRYVVHTAAATQRVPVGAIPLRIEAGLAFGTGQHATTTGCLLEIDERDAAPKNALDLGTGTAILALAIAKRWPRARITASDVDPVAIEVSATNARVNGVPLGAGPGEIMLVRADGLGDPQLAARGPFDLIAANILAEPLARLAPVLAAALAPGGSLILSGLLCGQADAVEASYAAAGLTPAARRAIGEWSTLRMKRG